MGQASSLRGVKRWRVVTQHCHTMVNSIREIAVCCLQEKLNSCLITDYHEILLCGSCSLSEILQEGSFCEELGDPSKKIQAKIYVE